MFIAHHCGGFLTVEKIAANLINHAKELAELFKRVGSSMERDDSFCCVTAIAAHIYNGFR